MVDEEILLEIENEIEEYEEMFGGHEGRNGVCMAPGKYPEIKVSGPNRYYAELLMEDYAGAVSELTAIHQYVHHHIMFGSEYKELAELEECIARSEMEHLEIIGELIKLLGEDPRFCTVENNEEVCWSPAAVYYGSNVCDRLAADIAGEKAAIKNYSQHYKVIDDPYIKAVLSRIINDEQYHVYRLYKAMQKYGCIESHFRS